MDFDNDDDIFGLDDFGSSSDESLDGIKFENGSFDDIDDNDNSLFDNFDTYNNDFSEESNNSELDISIDDIGEGYSNEPEDINDRKKIIKTSLIVIGVGLIVIFVGFGFNRLLQKKDIDTSIKEQPHVVTPTESVINEPIYNNDNVLPKDSDWIKFDGTFTSNSVKEFQSDFTVNKVDYYAKVSNDSSDKQVKAVVTGTITGLVGNYELEIPLEKSSVANIGTVFRVECKVVESNGYTVVYSLKYY